MIWCIDHLDISDVTAVYHTGGQDLTPIPLMIFRSNLKLDQKFEVLWFKLYSTNHNTILHTSQQLHCCDVQKFVVIGWVHFNLEQSKFYYILDLIEISLVGRGPSLHYLMRWGLHKMDAILQMKFKCIFSNGTFWILNTFSLKCVSQGLFNHR